MSKPIGTDILVNVILDRSGSMASIREKTIGGYNEYLNSLKADKETKYSVSLTQFDAPMGGPELTVSYVNKPLDEVPELTLKTYEPRGGTPLYDAIGETVKRVKEHANGRPVLTVIITDGHENASQEHTKDSIKALIAQLEKEGWTFTFLGANIDSFDVADAIGVRAANVSNYATAHMGATMKNMAAATTRYAASRRATKSLHQSADEAFMTEDEKEVNIGGNQNAGYVPKPGGRPTPRYSGFKTSKQ